MLVYAILLENYYIILCNILYQNNVLVILRALLSEVSYLSRFMEWFAVLAPICITVLHMLHLGIYMCVYIYVYIYIIIYIYI